MEPHGPAPRPEPEDRPRVRDRDVALVAIAALLAVPVISVVTGLIQPLDQVLTFAPVIVLLMIAATAIVVYRSIRCARRR